MKQTLLTFIIALLAATGAWAQTTFTADNLKYKVTNAATHTVELTGYVTEPEGALTIPATVTNGGTTYSVTAIGYEAFRECKALTSVTIPDGVTSIGYLAFSYCKALTSVTIPDGVTSIGFDAFRSCEALTAVSIPDGVTEIASYTFAYCYSLKSVTIGKGVTGIEIYAFGWSNNITELTVAATVPPTVKENAFFSVSKNISVYVPKESLAAYRAADGWKEFTNLKAIGSEFTAGNLKYEITDFTAKTVTLTGYVTKPTGALTIPATVTNGGTEYSVTSIGERAFYNCKAITAVTIPSSVTGIGDWAFRTCVALTSITIPASVTSIGDWAFRECEALTSITIPASVTSIGESAFEYCNALIAINVDEANEAYCSDGGILFNKDKTKLIRYPIARPETAYTVPASVTEIETSAFNACKKLVQITLPDGLTKIPYFGFGDCIALTEINIPESVTAIGESAFRSCSLKEITIPDGVTEIPYHAFGYCSALERVTLGKGITSLGREAFGKSRAIRELTVLAVNPPALYKNSFSEVFSSDIINIPVYVTKESLAAYKAADGWKEFTNLKAIGSGFTADNLKYEVTDFTAKTVTLTGYVTEPEGALTIPATVTNEGTTYNVTAIGDWAFYACNGITEMTVAATVPPTVGTDAFYQVSKTIPVYVPAASLAAYRAADGWKEFTNLKAIGSEFTAGNLKYEITDFTAKTVTLTGYVTKPTGALTIPAIVTHEGTEYSVTAIGERAFYLCNGITEMTVAATVPPTVGTNAFTGVSKSIPVYVSLEALDAYLAADGWKDFTNLQAKGFSSFTVDNLTYRVTGSTAVELTGYETEPTDILDIPATVTYEGKSFNVTAIKESAFSSCSKITLLTIPNTVKTIGKNAFYLCTGILEVTIPESVTKIGDFAFQWCIGMLQLTLGNGVTEIGRGAFERCNKLQQVTLGNNLATIGEKAFCSCESLKQVTVPESVTSIGSAAFGENPALTTINVAEGNTAYCSDGGILFSKDKTTLVQYPAGKTETAYAIPDGVTTIEAEAFTGCKKLMAVTFPVSVTAIGNSAFYMCTALKTITVPDGVTKIEDYTFNNCTALTKVTLGNGVTSIGFRVFLDCSALAEMTVTATEPPAAVTNAFYGVNLDMTVYVPAESLAAYKAANEWSNFTNIQPWGQTTFTVDNLTYRVTDETAKTAQLTGYATAPAGALDIPDSVTHESITYSVKSIGNKALAGCASLTEVTIPDGVTTMGNEAFSGCTALTKVTLGGSLTTMGNAIFNGCTALTEIAIPDAVTTIGTGTFSGCTKLTKAVLGNGVKSLGEKIFYGCTSLTQVTIPDGVSVLGKEAFSGCTALSQITLPESVISIGEGAFSSCTALTEITLPNSVRLIGKSAFSGCSALEKATLGSSVRILSDWAFYGCEALAEMTVLATEPPMASANTFENVSRSIPVYVPKASLEAYRAANVWNEFNLKEPPFVVDNLKYCVIDPEALTVEVIGYVDVPTGTLNIPATVTHDEKEYKVTVIADEAFAGCDAITIVSIGSNVTSIGANAFGGCTALAEINVDGSNTAYSSANGVLFDKAQTALLLYPAGKADAAYTVPDGVTAIGKEAVKGCTALTGLTLPATLTAVGEMAFAECTALAKMTVLATTPPTVSENTFDGVSRTIPVYVPATSLADYQAADVWSEFTALQAISTTGLQTPAMPESIAVYDGMLHNPQALEVRIFYMSGREVYRGNATNLTLPTGIYIVRCGEATIKAVF